MKIESEADWQKVVVRELIEGGAHVQVHTEAHSTGVPDISAGLGGKHYWLELKFARFGSVHQVFGFKSLTRKQLNWLERREAMSNSICGILGFYYARQPNPRSPVGFMCFIPARAYRTLIWGEKITIYPNIMDRFSRTWGAGGGIIKHMEWVRWYWDDGR